MKEFDIDDYSLTQDRLQDVDKWDRFVIYMSKILMPYLEYDFSIPFVKNGAIVLSVGVLIGILGYFLKIDILQAFAYPGIAMCSAFVFSLRFFVELCEKHARIECFRFSQTGSKLWN